MKVTARGQVTIPQSIRDQLGIQPGTVVDVSTDGRDIKIATSHGEVIDIRVAIDRMVGCAGPGLTTDEIMQLTRGED